jgi:hypothetical protein
VEGRRGKWVFKNLQRESRGLLAWERSSKHLEDMFVQTTWYVGAVTAPLGNEVFVVFLEFVIEARSSSRPQGRR